MRSDDHQSISSDIPHAVGTRLIHTMWYPLPWWQTRRGDRKLVQAREITDEFESVISRGDRQIIEEKITYAEDVKLGLDSKWWISRFGHARAYCKAARGACQFAKTASARGLAQVTANTTLFNDVMSVAQPLYRCYLTSQDAFPPPDMKADWLDHVWYEACRRTGVVDPRSLSLPHVEEFVVGRITLLSDIKTKITHLVESLYGFDTSRAPDSVSRNAKLAHALLANMAFIYREPNIGGTPQHPYRHPIIQEAINMIWFENQDGDGVVFCERFAPIPIQTISLVITVIEWCINEWTDGTHNASGWDNDHHASAYYSHISFLLDFRDHHNPQDEDLLQIQNDIFRNARMNAGAPYEPITGSGGPNLGAAIDENIPTSRDSNGEPIPTISISPS